MSVFVTQYLNGNVRWPHHVLPPGKSYQVCTTCSTKVEKRWDIDGQTDEWTPDRYIMLTAGRGHCNKHRQDSQK